MPGTNLTRDEAHERAEVVSRVHDYDVTLDLTQSDETFSSRTRITFDAEAGARTFVDLVATQVHSIELNGAALPTSAYRESRIELPELAEHNTLVIEATCRFTNTGEGMHRFVDPADSEAYLYTQFEVPDARRVFATFEQPDLKASFTFHVFAPTHWTVVSNEPGERTLDGERARWDFAPTPRLSTYITAIVAGPYHEVRGELTSRDGRTIPLGAYCRASLAEHLDAEEIFDITRAGFAFYEEAFDRPYPFTKYDQLFVPEYNAGAMENAGCVTFRDQYVFSSKPTEYMVERRVVTILHELAHMWFGDLVTMKWWNDLWLNESFAEFMCTLATAEATRFTTAWTTFASGEKAWAYTQDQLPSTHPIVAEIRDLADVEVNFDGITYAKGAAVLRALVAYVGREAFFAGVRTYFDRYAYGNTELADFLTELERASGRDLTAWSRVWLQEAGLTILRPDVSVDANGIVTDAAVVQESFRGSSLRPHRLTVGGYDVVDGELTCTWRSELDVDGARTELAELVGRPAPGMILVNDTDQAYAKVRMSAASLAFASAHIDAFADPLALAVLLGCAWDMTRDAELSGREFVELASRALAAPAMVPSVRHAVLTQLATAAERFTTPAQRADVVAAYGARLGELLRAAEPGSDAQLLYAQHFAAFATGPDQVETLAAIYRGDAGLSGLTLDDDLRWRLLQGLVAAGAAGEAEIAERQSADPSLTGVEQAARARAAMPSAEAKREAYRSALHDATLSNDVRAATMLGLFARAWQRPDLLAGLSEAYHRDLESMWANNSTAIAQALVLTLYPKELAGLEPVGAQSRAWLEDHADAPPALRRLVSEQLDDVTRAEATQQVGASQSRGGGGERG
ncbi:MAG: aminopeptidase N [Bowdeniella nasicola]|nr:aminopeptidase N [Bowdeniella nasicola]